MVFRWLPILISSLFRIHGRRPSGTHRPSNTMSTRTATPRERTSSEGSLSELEGTQSILFIHSIKQNKLLLFKTVSPGGFVVKIGDAVRFKSGNSTSTGIVTDIATQHKHYGGRRGVKTAGSPEDPRIVIKNDRTQKLSSHRPEMIEDIIPVHHHQAGSEMEDEEAVNEEHLKPKFGKEPYGKPKTKEESIKELEE
ncbi:hypothetical protein BC828DRAFT_150878 [Blastocladiella britannica]|nr:hypothetical protein BC828DRAFT_150878 [Blastocladiella britannica]